MATYLSWDWRLRVAGFLAISGAFAFFGNRTLAETIVPDATLGVERSVVTPGVDVGGVSAERIDGGAVRGVNLFHSFREFNVGNGGVAYFANPTGIENILSRVTGTNPSTILGKLGVLGNANLFVINPNGIIFGAGAQLDIRGSFFASTASSFKFPNGSSFSATNPQAPPLLTVNVTPGLQWGTSRPGATISNRGNLAVGQNLTLFADKLDLQGQLQAGRDITLLAQDTVRVRDSVKTPFLAQSGGNLTIQGNQGIDILALNHPTKTPFVSGGNLSLISDGIISGDARFSSGGGFSIRSVSGGLANFVSFHDPIFSASGNVDVAANYTGASLLVESKGNIRFGGNINITGPDTSSLPAGSDTATLSTRSALILRSGQSSLAYGGVNSGSVPAHSTGGVPAGITLGGDVILQPFNGAGGIVSLSAASGNVSTRLISTNGQQQNPYVDVDDYPYFIPPMNDANGGAISLSASNGSITTGDLYSWSYTESGTGAQGGAISLFAANGSINTGDLYSWSYSFYGSGAQGEAISLFAANGSINTGDLYSWSYSFYGNAGNGGNINLEAANSSIITGNLSSSSRSNSGNAGNGGNISLEAANGSITTGIFNSFSWSDSGNAGNGGNISIEATNGSITTDQLLSDSSSHSGSVGNGGNISIEATNGNITTGDYLDSSSGGQGGAISIEVANGRITTGSLYSGSVSLEATNGSITASDLVSGSVSLFTTNGSITTGSLSSYSGSHSGSADNGGAISIFTANGSITTGSLSSRSAGNGGAISIFTANGSITTGFLDSSSFSDSGNAGNGGAINIFTANGSITTGFLGSSSGSRYGNAGNGGEISIQAVNGSITTGPLYSYSSSGSGSAGQGGNISLFATNTIEFFTPELDTNTNLVTLVPGGASINSTGVLGSGNISIVSHAPLALDNSIISSDTFGSGRGGDIHISAGSISLTGGAQISASTHSSGGGGNITLIASDTVELNGATTKAPVGLFARTQTGVGRIPRGTFLGGFIPTGKVPPLDENFRPQFPPGILFPSGVFTQTTQGSTGNAGNIIIETGRLIIKDQAAIATTTWGQGSAGNIWVQARDSITVTNGKILSGVAQGARDDTGRIGEDGSINLTTGSLFLTDRGVVDAKTLSGNAGNINLQVRDLLLMRDNSQISASAGTIEARGDGGNITISAPFVVAVPSENSDIRANAHTGTGGRVDITANGIFGFQVQREDTPNSDISASSRFGVQGSVTLNILDVDPSRGLTNLPTEVVDVSNQIDQNCSATRAVASEQSSFVVTGRGGLPPNPKEPLSKDAVQVDWVTLNPERENRSSSAVAVPETSATSAPLVEAQGWLRNPKGQVVLTASAPTATPHSPWQTPTNCSAPRSTPSS
jgi:filamentous hemagglutinin family protein